MDSRKPTPTPSINTTPPNSNSAMPTCIPNFPNVEKHGKQTLVLQLVDCTGGPGMELESYVLAVEAYYFNAAIVSWV